MLFIHTYTHVCVQVTAKILLTCTQRTIAEGDICARALYRRYSDHFYFSFLCAFNNILRHIVYNMYTYIYIYICCVVFL